MTLLGMEAGAPGGTGAPVRQAGGDATATNVSLASEGVVERNPNYINFPPKSQNLQLYMQFS